MQAGGYGFESRWLHRLFLILPRSPPGPPPSHENVTRPARTSARGAFSRVTRRSRGPGRDGAETVSLSHREDPGPAGDRAGSSAAHLPASAPRPSSSSHSSTNPDEKGSVKPLGAVQIFWSGVEGGGGQGGAVVGVVVVERGGRAAKRGLGRAAALALSLLVLLGRDGSDRAGDAGASATPFSFYCVSSPFTTPLPLVQWRVKRRSRGKRA